MDIIKTKNCGGPMDVIFDGRFIFIEKFHGLVAIVQPIHNDNYDLVGYHIERTLAIDPSTVLRIISRYRSAAGMRDVKVEDCMVHQFVGSLPYKIELNIMK